MNSETCQPTAESRHLRLRVGACPAHFGCIPKRDEVLAWVIDLGAPPLAPAELFTRLTPEEQSRATRYKIPKAREQFVIGRGLLRGLLSECLDTSPDAVPLDYLPSGKPVLRESPLQFNVTHTDGIAILAVGYHRLGVDVERVRTIADAEGLVSRYFSPAECAAFRALPAEHRDAGFFRGWTCKESLIKAIGATVACLAEFDVELHPERPPRLNAARDPRLAGIWALAEWRVENAAMAVAVEGCETLTLEHIATK